MVWCHFEVPAVVVVLLFRSLSWLSRTFIVFILTYLVRRNQTKICTESDRQACRSTHGIMISLQLLMICLPIMMTASCSANSARHPPLSAHCMYTQWHKHWQITGSCRMGLLKLGFPSLFYNTVLGFSEQKHQKSDFGLLQVTKCYYVLNSITKVILKFKVQFLISDVAVSKVPRVTELKAKNTKQLSKMQSPLLVSSQISASSGLGNQQTCTTCE